MELWHPFLTTPTLIFFDQILISMNMYQHAKNKALSLFRDIAYLIILQSDWPITFWSISQEPDFSQVWDLCKNTTNNIHFIYCCLQGWLYSPVHMRNSSYKKSHKFWRLPLCSILYLNLMEFSEIRDKEFQLGFILFQTC